MEDLETMTAAELVEVHNARCAEGEWIEGPWKRSKAELVERIGAIGDAEAAKRETAGTEEAKADDAEPKTTVRALAESLLAAADGEALTYEEIAERIRQELPGSATTPQSIRWYATKMRKRGETVRVCFASRKVVA